MSVVHEEKAVLSITASEVEQARALTARVEQGHDAESVGSIAVMLRSADSVVDVPPELAAVLSRVIELLGRGRTVTVGSIPDEVTTTVAAKMLHISRPTLMKLIGQGDIPARKVGSHTRLLSRDVLAYRETRRAARREDFDRLRELEDELGVAD
ncbi:MULTISPECIES: helix-turn-helix domain-containing protein [Nocardia]|uniref:helix-turn-helix domain-containing protein n=1 Tax=Nocardia TaxID=1817 RepID=UPI000D69B2E0|nr:MULTISPECIES: helix-turn-helix domain-containing protein [Nocardia]